MVQDDYLGPYFDLEKPNCHKALAVAHEVPIEKEVDQFEEFAANFVSLHILNSQSCSKPKMLMNLAALHTFRTDYWLPKIAKYCWKFGVGSLKRYFVGPDIH